MDINKCLFITVKEKGNNNKNKIEIKYNKISDEEIERLIEEGEKNEENDKKEIQQIKKFLEEIEKIKKDNDVLKKENIKKENEINELNDKLKYANNGYNEMNRQLMVLIENKRKIEKE